MQVDYATEGCAPSAWETVFLHKGWGIRDARGPYMTGSKATIRLPSWALSSRVASHLQIGFGLSNRSPVNALTFYVSGYFGNRSFLIQRNSDIDIIISEVSPRPDADDYDIDVTIADPAYPQPHSQGLMDLFAINKLSIRRGRIAKDDYEYLHAAKIR
jgi:hypothetical protein